MKSEGMRLRTDGIALWYEGDALAGKRTIAVRLGEPAARRYTRGLLIGSYACLPAIGLAARSAWPAISLRLSSST